MAVLHVPVGMPPRDIKKGREVPPKRRGAANDYTHISTSGTIHMLVFFYSYAYIQLDIPYCCHTLSPF